MRSTLSALMIVVALVVAAVAGPALWLQQNVVDQRGFVAMAGPLGSNAAFQEGLTSMLSEQATASMNLSPQLSSIAGTLITSAAQNVYTEPGYEQAWRETLQRSHQLTFAAAGNNDVAGDIMLDLAPLVSLVVDKVAGDLPFTVPSPEDVVISVEQPEAAKLLPAVTLLGGWSGWLLAAAVVLFVAGVMVARRRGLALVLTGLGLGIVALIWLLAAGFVQTFLGDLAVGPESARQVGVELGSLARASWQGGINATFITAVVVAVAGGATLMVGRNRTA